jgi:hypothetical protein
MPTLHMVESLLHRQHVLAFERHEFITNRKTKSLRSAESVQLGKNGALRVRPAGSIGAGKSSESRGKKCTLAILQGLVMQKLR